VGVTVWVKETLGVTEFVGVTLNVIVGVTVDVTVGVGVGDTFGVSEGSFIMFSPLFGLQQKSISLNESITFIIILFLFDKISSDVPLFILNSATNEPILDVSFFVN
jgi:hypothetical protein